MVEELLSLYQDQHLRVITLSPGFVYGPGGLFKGRNLARKSP